MIRFSTEDVGASASDTKPKATNFSRQQRKSGDWLGLKTADEPNYREDGAKKMKSAEDSPKIPSSPLLERKPSLVGSQSTSVAKTAAENQTDTKPTKSEVSRRQKKEEEEDEDDWLAGALSRKKALSGLNTDAKTTRQNSTSGFGEKVELESIIRYCVRHTKRQKQYNDIKRKCVSQQEMMPCFVLLVIKTHHKIPESKKTLFLLSRKQGIISVLQMHEIHVSDKILCSNSFLG